MKLKSRRQKRSSHHGAHTEVHTEVHSSCTVPKCTVRVDAAAKQCYVRTYQKHAKQTVEWKYKALKKCFVACLIQVYVC